MIYINEMTVLMVRGAVGWWGGGDTVRARGYADGRVGDWGSWVRDGSMTAAGVTTAGVTTAGVPTAGVTTAGVATLTTRVTRVAWRVTFLSLVVLRHLDSLLEVLELNAYDPLVGYTVDWGRGSVVRWDSVGTVSGRRGAVSLVLDLILQDDVPDLLQ